MKNPLLPALVLLSFCLAGCKSTDVGFSPDTQDYGGRTNMSTNILSPKSGQVFVAGKDIPIEAVATDLSGIGQVIIMVNNKQIAKDTQAPYTVVIPKAAPGQYLIQSYATNKYGDNKLSSLVTITVK